MARVIIPDNEQTTAAAAMWQRLLDDDTAAPTLDEAVAAGIEATADESRARFLHGAICDRLETRHGQNTVQDFARNVGVSPKTVYERRDMVRYYGLPTCANFLDRRISYSLARIAARAHRGDSAAALLFLDEADANGWTCDEAQKVLAERSGKSSAAQKIASLEAVVIRVDGEQVTLSDIELSNALRAYVGKVVMVTVREVEVQ